MLTEKDDTILFRHKCELLISKVFIKPLKSPLEETLRLNNISADEFGFSFSELKKVRDQITHGSVSSIPEDKLKEYTFAIQKICICLILAQLGFKEEIKTVHNRR